ncbi:MAG: YraN family protein [Treponema sp.]|nr:YraN family protein [Treponema sp.]
MNNSSLRGRGGEEQAAEAVKAAGMEIIARNIRSKYGEIDIVALEGETIVFIEVKAWTSYSMEDLQYSVDLRKQKKIIKTAKYFLSENRKYNKMTVRFDVIFIKNNSITHLASAFTEHV